MTTHERRSARVVIVGGGFAGLEVARGLARAPVEVVVIDRNNFHTFQPLLYQVAAAGLNADDICHSLRGILRPQENASVVLGDVAGVDVDAREVVLGDGRRIGYDHLVVACGLATSAYGVPGVGEHAFSLKTLQDALALRAQLLERFERAEREGGGAGRGDLDVVVVGGGPTGVELAGALRELFDSALARDFPALPVREARIFVLEAGDRLLSGLHPSSSAYAADALRRKGVEVVLGAQVTRVSRRGVCLADGSWLRCSTTVWVAGVEGPPLLRGLEAPRTRDGRIVVEADLSVPGRPELFVVGDAAAVVVEGRALPQLAPFAIQGGRHVARVLTCRLAGRPAPSFHPRYKGTMATIGRNQAVAEVRGGLRFTGRPAWLAWLALHLVYLIGFRNRLSVLLNWSWSYLTYDRAARLLLPAPTVRSSPTEPAGPSDGGG